MKEMRKKGKREKKVTSPPMAALTTHATANDRTSLLREDKSHGGHGRKWGSHCRERKMSKQREKI